MNGNVASGAQLKGALMFRDNTSQSWRDCKKVHPLSARFPRLSPERLQELAQDIEKRGGLVHPVLTCTRQEDGHLYVYDGANRLDACELLGWQLVDDKGSWRGKITSFIEYRGTKTDAEVTADVESLNVQRRDLTASQRAMLAAEKANVSRADTLRKGSRPARVPLDAVTQAQAAERYDVSERLVREAVKVRRKAPQEVGAVKRGEKTVSEVADQLGSDDDPEMAVPSAAETEQHDLELHFREAARDVRGMISKVLRHVDWPFKQRAWLCSKAATKLATLARELSKQATSTTP